MWVYLTAMSAGGWVYMSAIVLGAILGAIFHKPIVRFLTFSKKDDKLK